MKMFFNVVVLLDLVTGSACSVGKGHFVPLK